LWVDGGRYILMSFAGDTADIAAAVDLPWEWLD
jgi:hypothetical protein